MPEKLTLRYDDQFITEVATLPSVVAEALYEFLNLLADDPDSPDLGAEPAPRGLWGCQFTHGYCVYWKVEREPRSLVTLASWRPLVVSLVKLKPQPDETGARSRRA